VCVCVHAHVCESMLKAGSDKTHGIFFIHSLLCILCKKWCKNIQHNKVCQKWVLPDADPPPGMRENDTARSTLPLRITAHTCTGLPSTVVYSVFRWAMDIPVGSEGSIW